MLETNIVMAYGIIWGQCTKSLKAKLEARKEWNKGDADLQIKYNAINLLKAIKEITHNYQDNKYAMESIYFSLKNIFTMKQEENENLTEFTKRFNNTFDIMETQHGVLSLSAYLANRSDYKAATTSTDKKAIHKREYDGFKAFVYLKAVDQRKSGKLVEDLGNQFALGNDQFPKTVVKATEAVVAYRNRVNASGNNNGNQGGNRNRQQSTNQSNNNTNQNVSFQQSQKQTQFRDNSATVRDLSHIKCYHCGEMGHYANKCPKTNKGQSHVHFADDTNFNDSDNDDAFHAIGSFIVESPGVHHESFQQSAKEMKSTKSAMKDWIVLDTGSSTDIFCNKRLLNGVSKEPRNLVLHTNGGVLECNQTGEFAKYGKVWHDQRALTNILSFYHLQSKFKVVSDNRSGDNSFHVFTEDGKEIIFSPSQSGIYRYDNSNQDFCFTETVADNSKFFTRRQVEQARLARKLYNAVGTPSTRDFKTMVRSNMIKTVQ